MKKEIKLDKLDHVFSQKLIAISKRNPKFNDKYLVELHAAVDWAMNELRKIDKNFAKTPKSK